LQPAIQVDLLVLGAAVGLVRLAVGQCFLHSFEDLGRELAATRRIECKRGTRGLAGVN
jgi:hypothetical protein